MARPEKQEKEEECDRCVQVTRQTHATPEALCRTQDGPVCVTQLEAKASMGLGLSHSLVTILEIRTVSI